MSNYTKLTNFAVKDSLTTGDPDKKIKGAEIDAEYNSIATAVNSKANIASPSLTGTPTAPTAAEGTNTTQIATTAFVGSAVNTAISALGDLSSQNASSVSIEGGTIDNTTVGATTASSGKFTTLQATTSFQLDTWTIVESEGVLYFLSSGVNKAKLDASGNFTVTGDVTAYGTV